MIMQVYIALHPILSVIIMLRFTLHFTDKFSYRLRSYVKLNNLHLYKRS